FFSDLYIDEELVFIDNLENFCKKLPTLSVLLSRLQFFLVKDPLLDSEGQNLKEENIFRECLSFQYEMKMKDVKEELQGIKEDFRTISVKDEEVSSCCFLLNYFLLPVELEFCKCSSGRSNAVKITSYLELKELLNLAPETVAHEDKEVIEEDLKAEYKPEIFKYCPITEEVWSCNSSSMMGFSESDEMEVPLTPPHRQRKACVNFVSMGLQEEPIPLSGNSILITEPARKYLECLLWQAEKYQDNMNSLLLVEHPTVKLGYQRDLLTELKKMVPVEVETPVLSFLEDGWWLHLGLNPVSIETLERLNVDGSNANCLLCTEVETFMQFPSLQLEKKDSITNQELFSDERHQSDKLINPYMTPQTERQYFEQHMDAASSAKNHSTHTTVEELTEGSIKKNEAEDEICFLNQEKKSPESYESVNSYVSSKQDNSSSSQKPASLATKWDGDDSDLSNFIILRSKHALTPKEEKNYVDNPEKVPQSEEQQMHVHKEDGSVCETARMEEKELENEDSVTVDIQASESQCQAYCLLEEAATPVLKDLKHLGVLASVNWRFDSVKFDHTRFFLKQQEKVICDRYKEGEVDDKEIMLFRHAALVHLLVTVRDLLLMCGLDTALGYLSNAKDIYKNILESCLNNIWRQLKIVQYSSQKKHETNPKITELQCQVLNWMQRYGGEHSVKVLIITRMDFETEKGTLIHTLSKGGGIKAMDLNSEKKGAILTCKDIISNRYSCVIVHNQQIGADFPWTHFSLVVEFDYSENSCWKNLCKNLNVTYMTFKTTLPEAFQMGNPYGSFLLEVQIPYVFLATEGLLNMPDILQLLESKYSITFVERSSCYSLQLFGRSDRYVVLTVDQCTAIFLQSMEELNYEKSGDNVVSKLMALSLQYTCCWVLFYSKKSPSLQYSLRGDTLLNLVLIYATLIELQQKSEDFEVKVALMPGIEETALVIRQIVDNTLIASNISPQEWLDKSWLSVLPSEAEQCLLNFPSINPLVAQFMLKKVSSLNKLFLASFDQLQELLPEVPKKVLKHFSEITSSYSLNAAAPLGRAVKGPSPLENQNKSNTF
ncbi:SHOC1 protein, partial [Turnix velox]|nr:SHOC1 protein [Turnix velox]